MFKHDIWDQIKHITSFVLLFSESFYGQYMNIDMNRSRKVTWKWGPVMETGMSTSHVKLCAGGSPVKQDPSSPFPPKVQTSGSPTLSALNYIRFQKWNIFLASTVNQIQNNLSSTTIQQQRKLALYITVNSPHIRSCFRNPGKSRATHLSQ